MKTTMNMNKRLQDLVAKHVNGFRHRLVEDVAREIAEDLLRPLFDKVKPATSATGPALPGMPAHYDPRTKRWLCPRCKKFADFQRRSVTTHMRSCQVTSDTVEMNPLACTKCPDVFTTEAQLSGHLRWCGKDPKKAMIRVCIKPGCKKLNRGPRFRFLCMVHDKASEKQVERWRKERAERNGL